MDKTQKEMMLEKLNRLEEEIKGLDVAGEREATRYLYNVGYLKKVYVGEVETKCQKLCEERDALRKELFGW